MFRAWLHTYQNKFNPATHTEETASLWAVILVSREITNEQFKIGFFKSLDSKHTNNGFPVSTVHEFYDLCFDFNFLPVDKAFANALECAYPFNKDPKWADGIVYETVKRMTTHSLVNGTESIKRVFMDKYNTVINEVKAGAVFELPEISGLLTDESDSKKVANEEVANEYLSKIKEMVGLGEVKL